MALRVARDVAHGLGTATHGKSCGARCGGPPRIFFKNCRLRGGAPRSFTRSSVPDLFFAFLALSVEFSSLLITKMLYT